MTCSNATTNNNNTGYYQRASVVKLALSDAAL